MEKQSEICICNECDCANHDDCTICVCECCEDDCEIYD